MAVEKSYCSDSHCSKFSKSFCSTSHSSKSAKCKTPSSHSSKPSKKKSSALSKYSYSATGSSSTSYLSVSECHKTAEHVKLATRQVEERTQRQLKLLEQSFEFETQNKWNPCWTPKPSQWILTKRSTITIIIYKWFQWKFNTKMGE